MRDRLYSLAYGLTASLLFFVFYLSVRIHLSLFGGISLSSIVSFDKTPQILFYSSLLSLTSLFFFHSLHRLGDIGVMMAVGGNRLGCIWLHTLVLFLLFSPSSLVGFFLGKLISPPGDWTLSLEFMSWGTGTAFFILLGFVVSFPTIGLSSFVDPYRSIRRQK